MSNDPLHGVTLNAMLVELEQAYGWDELAKRIRINCFAKDPSIKSSLKFLRRTPWARAKVEALFVAYKQGDDKQGLARAGVGRKPNRRGAIKPAKPAGDSGSVWPSLK